MKAFMAFFKKEWLEQLRSGRLLILLIIFLLFGIMNPAIAKLTPWMMELMSDTLAENGMFISEIEVTALTSWTQFYKNIPMALIVFVLMLCSCMTNEYQRGTLIPVLTKGLSRWKVICTKALMVFLLWTGGYALTYIVTYSYNSFFWDNGIANHLFTAAIFYYLFGVWVISLVILFSAVTTSNTGVLLGSGGSVLMVYLISMLPKIQKYLPMKLSNGMEILTGTTKPKEFVLSLIITLMLIALNVIFAVSILNKRKI